jgi:hypothetical protein
MSLVMHETVLARHPAHQVASHDNIVIVPHKRIHGRDGWLAQVSGYDAMHHLACRV